MHNDVFKIVVATYSDKSYPVHIDWHCVRALNGYDGIMCPEGHYKIAREKFETDCDDKGLPCPEGKTCYCKPCIEAYEVDVFPWDIEVDGPVTDGRVRCDKMAVCGEVQQTEELVFQAYDNLKRPNATVTAVVHLGQESRNLEVVANAGGFNQYEFKFSNGKRGVAILEVSFDGVQIPESPFRIDVTERHCPMRRMVAVSIGTCST